jgi:hypothetical protein
VERSARVASFRRIDWDSYGFNYVLVFSPNALADAPYNLAATIELPGRENPVSRAILSGLVHALPSSSVIEVGRAGAGAQHSGADGRGDLPPPAWRSWRDGGAGRCHRRRARTPPL